MRLFLATVLAISSFSVFAEGAYVGYLDALAQPRFQLSFQSELVQQNRNTTARNDANIALQGETSGTSSYFVGSLKRYDATWLYPVSQSVGMNVDLGMNLQ